MMIGYYLLSTLSLREYLRIADVLVGLKVWSRGNADRDVGGTGLPDSPLIQEVNNAVLWYVNSYVTSILLKSNYLGFRSAKASFGRRLSTRVSFLTRRCRIAKASFGTPK